MTEQEWTDKYLTGSPRGWEGLVEEGRVPLKELDDGPLKSYIDQWLQASSDIDKLLERYNYEAG